MNLEKTLNVIQCGCFSLPRDLFWFFEILNWNSIAIILRCQTVKLVFPHLDIIRIYASPLRIDINCVYEFIKNVNCRRSHGMILIALSSPELNCYLSCHVYLPHRVKRHCTVCFLCINIQFINFSWAQTYLVFTSNKFLPLIY